jgi:hypothetical protein
MSFKKFLIMAFATAAAWLAASLLSVYFIESSLHLCGIRDATEPTFLCPYKEELTVLWLLALFVIVSGAVFSLSNRSR